MLMAVDRGMIHKFRGKRLADININGIRLNCFMPVLH